MKKVILFALAMAAVCSAMMAQSDEEMQQLRRDFMHKRDISQKHLDTNIPLGETKAQKGVMSLPTDRVWFPGEWEEVDGIVVTPYYDYYPKDHVGSYNWMADPMVSGYAQYYRYSGGWSQAGGGEYVAVVDTTSTFSKVFYYIMDAIQAGGAQAVVRVENTNDSSIVLRRLQRMGLRSNNIRFIAGTGNSFWYRDCGPICFYYGDQDSVGMLDFTYYPGRALDDSLPSIMHHQLGIPNYLTDIEWEGGNCLVDGMGFLFTSDAIYGNNQDTYGQLSWDGHNPSTINYTRKTALTKAQVKEAMRSLIGQRETHILPAFRYDGGTGHVDLYADMCEENSFVFSQFPAAYSNWTDYATASKNIDSLCSYASFFGRPYGKTYIPFPSNDNGGNFSSQNDYDNNYTRTYSNHTFVNDLIIQPCFSAVQNGEPTAEWDRANVEALKAAYPGYKIYPIDVREFDGSGGAIHCVTKQIPAQNPIRILHKSIVGDCSAMRNRDIPVAAVITNKSGIAHAECMYRVNGGDWNSLQLASSGNVQGKAPRFSGLIPATSLHSDSAMTVEYYLTATSNNGKTITKPMTAQNGGYYSFVIDTVEAEIDSTLFDFATEGVEMNDITFLFSTDWTNEDSSEPAAIAAVEESTVFGQFYPNPASQQASINISIDDAAAYTVSIVDAMGRTVHTSRLEAEGSVVFTINASKLATGAYSVIFSNAQGQNVVRRLIVK